jgi:hypothetical protein
MFDGIDTVASLFAITTSLMAVWVMARAAATLIDPLRQRIDDQDRQIRELHKQVFDMRELLIEQ